MKLPGMMNHAMRLALAMLVLTLPGTVFAGAQTTKYTLKVTKSGVGVVTSAPSGIACGSTCSFAFNRGTVVTLWTTPSAGYTFTGWSGACSGTGNCVVTMSGARTVTATFSLNSTYNLSLTRTGNGTVTSAPAGISCGTNCSYAFASGNVVTLWATPDPGHVFTGWGGACTGTGDCVLTMNGAKTLTASFQPATQILSVARTGNGTVTSAPAGISCGTTCAFPFTRGNVVTLWATPDTGYTFSGWSGACGGAGDCVLTMDGDKSITAAFAQQPGQTLTVSRIGGGRVTSNPAGIDCGATCSREYPSGSSVTLTAVADAGYIFSGWTGACSGTGSCVVTLSAATGVTASFSPSNPGASLPALGKGVNLAHWLTNYGRQPMVEDDMIKIKNAGFDHVRIPFDPEFLGWNPDDTLNAGTLPQQDKLDAAIALAIGKGLVAVVDLHPNGALKNRIETEAKVQDSLVKLWTQLADRYKARGEGELVYELLNEPQYWTNGPAAWYVLRQRLLDAVRAKDTRHLVLLSGGYGGGLRSILENQTVTDIAVGYTFHYYEPYLFTHNGAPWEPHLSSVEDMFTGLLYPAALNSMSNIIMKPGADINAVTQAITDYKAVNWSQRIASDINSVKAWAASHGNVKVFCNEFGALRLTQDETSRSNYIRDVRTAVEAAGMGWTAFDYADIFGIARATGSTYLSGDGATVPADPANPQRVFTPGNLDALFR